MTTYLIAIFFFVGYAAITAEKFLKIHKTSVALSMAAACWALFFLARKDLPNENLALLHHALANASEILFFLMGAMAIVELIHAHRGFIWLTNLIATASQRKLLVGIAVATFLFSAILDNLTATILMLSLIRNTGSKDKEERLMMGALIVVAANAGGVWSPIGDITTTMLWIAGRLSPCSLMKALILPSAVSLLVPLLYFLKKSKKEAEPLLVSSHQSREPAAFLVLVIGLMGLILAPILKEITALPPYMGVLTALSLLWMITDKLHSQKRPHLRMSYIFSQLDLSTILFFLGILLSIAALEAIGLLDIIALWLKTHLSNYLFISLIIAGFSALIDNIPMVAATIGIYPLEQVGADSPLWHLIAYSAGVGGSILITGSSSGIALMGMERIDFFSYLRKISIPVLIGYGAGVVVYCFQNLF